MAATRTVRLRSGGPAVVVTLPMLLFVLKYVETASYFSTLVTTTTRLQGMAVIKTVRSKLAGHVWMDLQTRLRFAVLIVGVTCSLPWIVPLTKIAQDPMLKKRCACWKASALQGHMLGVMAVALTQVQSVLRLRSVSNSVPVHLSSTHSMVPVLSSVLMACLLTGRPTTLVSVPAQPVHRFFMERVLTGV